MSKKLILLSLWLFIGAGVVDVEAQTAEFLGLSGITIYPVLPHPTDLSTLYVGTQNNGLYKTSDQGSNWQSMNNGMSDNSVWNVRFDPNNTNRMYAATGVIGSQGSSDLFYVSSDGGQNWSLSNTGLAAKYMWVFVVDPNNTNNLYVGSNGAGVYKSTDAGANWFASNSGIESTYIQDLDLNPSNSQIVWAAASGGKLYKSTNSGGSWSTVNVPSFTGDTYDLVFKPSDSNTMFIGTNGNGVYKSANGGSVWSQMNSGLGDLYVYDLVVDESSGTLYAGTKDNGIYQSTNDGSSWDHIDDGGVLSGSIITMAVSPVDPNYLFVGMSSGMYQIVFDTTPEEYTISGYVRDSGSSAISGVTMNGLPGNPTTDGSGSYSVSVSSGWSGTVTPSLSGYTFTPTERAYSSVSSDQSNQDYTGTSSSVTISGYVRTSGGTGIQNVAMNGLPGSPSTNSSGYYSTSVSYNWSGTVTPFLSGYTFTPTSRDYSNVVSNQSNQDYTGTVDTGPATLILTSPSSGNSWEVGTTQQITWTSTGSITSVKILLTRNNGGSWSTLHSSTTNDGSYSWTVTNYTSNLCMIQIEDASDNSVYDVMGSSFSITPETFTDLDLPTAIHAGTTQTSYRLFSVPGVLDDSRMSSHIPDDLGSYDDTRWRLYRYSNGWREYDSAMRFSPGEAYFLIVAASGRSLRFGTGYTIGDYTYSMSLAAGWNLIGNPYGFGLDISSLSLSNGGDITLNRYQGSWTTTTTFTEWEGYALYVDNATTLTVDPVWGTAAKPVVPPNIEETADWFINIEATCEEAKDTYNRFGVHQEAEPGKDRFDLYEPPPIGEYITLYFQKDVEQNGGRFATDFMPHSEQGWTWDFVVETVISDALVELDFSNLESIPVGSSIRLIDIETNISTDLMNQKNYSFVSGSDITRRQFRLTIGDQDHLEAPTPLSNGFMLHPNYPNPFNAMTTIPFTLNQTSSVSLCVLNVKGEVIRMLIDREERQVGSHTVVWDGRNRLGETVSTGIYFYRIMTDTGYEQIRKASFLK